ncbi:nucleotidyltransferase domain-containing protein [Allomesorhizobium camelthorni]|uniref:anti-phage Hailong system nucleotidyltransferase HalB n=1 Tax=Allomesorhizobium camelthorni TaxID=475069 RepID=UPI0024835FFB|nr:nucleotidyltransferase domain-containing protein [Mesorhizobium camelthorni]
MPIAAVLLFGSLARGDQAEGSDTDLLMINTDNETRHLSKGHASLFLYPWTQLRLDAGNGDLFVCHLVREAKALVDPEHYLSKLRAAFRFRSNYESEVKRATDLGWFLVRFGETLNPNLQAKRTLWCIRTILIARSAERREPVFAPQLLAQRTKSDAARDLLRGRHNPRDSAALSRSLRAFLEEETKTETFYQEADRITFGQRFAATSNRVALQTLDQEDKSRAGYL